MPLQPQPPRGGRSVLSFELCESQSIDTLGCTKSDIKLSQSAPTLEIMFKNMFLSQNKNLLQPGEKGGEDW